MSLMNISMYQSMKKISLNVRLFYLFSRQEERTEEGGGGGGGGKEGRE
jgi:hypothetical protein